MTETVALDMDSTLAATWRVAFDLLEGPNHGRSYDDLTYWDWGADEYGTNRFLSALWGAWSIRSDDVEPMERGLRNTVQRLYDEYDVHIVTTQPDRSAITEGKKAWLAQHRIPHHEFVPMEMGLSKGESNRYSYYVDDKPGFVENVPEFSTLYLRDQPYNRGIDTDEYENVERVRTVAEAVNRILQ